MIEISPKVLASEEKGTLPPCMSTRERERERVTERESQRERVRERGTERERHRETGRRECIGRQ